MSKRNEQGRRFRDVRQDAGVGATEKRIEDDYGLPPGSISIRNPDGKDARSDKKIGKLRKDYNKK